MTFDDPTPDSSSDDSQSLTSASAEDNSQDEWAVRRILAEAKVRDEVRYLIDWDGFDLCEATWEPASHLSEGLLEQWLATTKETGKKTALGFTIESWRQAVSDDIRAKYAKHVARNKKRDLRGLEQIQLDCTLEEWISSVQGEYRDEIGDIKECSNAVPPTLDDNPRVVKTAQGRKQDTIGGQQGTHQGEMCRSSEDPHSQRKSNSLAREGLQVSSDVCPNKNKVPTPSMPDSCSPALRERTSTANPSSKGAPIHLVSPKLHSAKKVSARKPVMDAAQLSNVFIGGTKRKARRNLLDVASDINQAPKLLNHRKRRLIQKGLRDKEGVTAPAPLRNQFLAETHDLVVPGKLDMVSNNGNHKGILLPSGSLVHAGSESTEKAKKRVHWEDSIPNLELQDQDEFESLFVDDDTSPRTPDDYESKERDSTETVSKDTDATTSVLLDIGSEGHTISKVCRFGPDGRLVALLTFHGMNLSRNPSWACLFEGQSQLDFCHTCTKQDVLSQTGHRTLEELSVCQGTVSFCEEDRLAFVSVTSQLQIGCAGAVCQQNDFCILIFCPSPLSWAEASSSAVDLPQGEPGLGFLIFKSAPQFPLSMLAPIVPPTAVQRYSVSDSLEIFDMFFDSIRAYLGLDQEDKRTPINFFLLFPPTAHQLVILFSRWLQESIVNCNIKTSLQPGQWSTFSALDSGTIIVHEDALSTLSSLPGLSNILHSQRGVRFEFLAFSPSGALGKHFPQLNNNNGAETDGCIIRLFPQGTVILLTPSFFVSQPEAAYSFLKWFRQYNTDRGSLYGPKKLAAWSDIHGWLLDLALHKGSQKMHSEISASKRSIEALLKCFNLLQNIISEVEDDHEGPLIYAPEVLDGNDEQSLVNWFGSWAGLHIHHYRKFLVLGSSNHVEARLSRVIRSVQFITSCTEHLPCQNAPTSRLDGNLWPESSVYPEVALAAKAQSFLTEIDESYTGLTFSPLVLYRFPITYWGPKTTLQWEEFVPFFKDYGDWFDDFKQPFFSRIMKTGAINVLPNFKNTYLGLFFTTDKEHSTTSASSQEVRSLHPWIAIYRPAEIHIKPWRSMELLLWDPYVRHHNAHGNGLCETDLVPAQKALITHIREKSRDPKTTFPLERVWVGPFDHQQDDGVVDPFDSVFRWIASISRLVKERLPLCDKQLRSRGWRMFNPETMSSYATRLNAAKTPSTGSNTGNPSLALRTVFPAPRPATATEPWPICNNRFQEAVSRHRGSHEIPFTFQPTLKWYGEQVEAGRGLHHIKVSDWQSVFARYKIQDSGDEY